jgi:hypothetical protein
MTFIAKFVVEEAPKSRRHVELFFGRVGLRSLSPTTNVTLD